MHNQRENLSQELGVERVDPCEVSYHLSQEILEMVGVEFVQRNEA